MSTAKSPQIKTVATTGEPTPESAAELADDIFSASCKWTEESDVVGAAVLKIIDYIASENDPGDRWNKAHALRRAIYAGTKAHEDALNQFAE